MERYLLWPLIFSSTGLIPPATPTNYIIWRFVGFISTNTLSVAVTLHGGLSTITSSLQPSTMSPPSHRSSCSPVFSIRRTVFGIDTIQAWWANNIFAATEDYKREPFYKLAVNQTFGPATW